MSSTTVRRGLAVDIRPRARPFWESAYASVLALADALAITLACALALAVRFQGSDASFRSDLSDHPLSYNAFIALIAPTWVAMLALGQAYQARLLGVGAEEFKRVINASIRFVAVVAFASFFFKADVARGFIGVVVPAGLAFLLLGRYSARKVLHSLRTRQLCLHRVVVVGSVEEVTHLTEQVQREPYAGLLVVAVALPDYVQGDLTVGDLTLVNIGPARELARRLSAVDADTVAVAGTSAMSSRELRELAWALEGSGTDLIVNPAITDVAGPRIHIRPVAGLPLLHVESPEFGGARRVIKRGIDILGSLLVLGLLFLPLALIALLIRVEGGPAFFRQTRVGRGSGNFRIWKFRSMAVDAEQQIVDLARLNERDGPMFKMARDPRITRVGAVLRKYSLDELPQLFNVLGGSMSLVGPRPPLPTEVDVYEDHVRRRLLVKPGMTGLWQVSGRADLSWEDSVRLDLYYVENWSVLLDVQILWKTVFAVLQGRGAY